MPEWTETETDGRTVKARIFRGSMLQADGDVLCLGEGGHLLWLSLGPKGVTVLSKARLFPADESFTGPVLSRGLLYICQNKRGRDGSKARLICYDLRGK